MSVTATIVKGRRKLPFIGFLVKTTKVLTSVAVTMLGLLFITFFIGRVMPLDPTLAIVGESASKQTYEEAYRSLGLDKPLVVQFFYYVSDVAHGDFGKSSRTGFPVATDIKRVFPDRKSTRLNSSHIPLSRMPSSA